jgi:type 1 glutamine amidotransferase
VSRRALVTWGGWDGHRPEECAAWAAEVLRRNGFGVAVADSLAPLLDPFAADELDLVVPVWSIADAPDEELDAFVALVARGTGVAAFHGATATFRRHYGWQRVLGGQFVWHPEPLDYTVQLRDGGELALHSEQYYLHVDPANELLATTTFEDGTVMPVAWRRQWGDGRVFYSSLGHDPDVLRLPEAEALWEAGARWAARG